MSTSTFKSHFNMISMNEPVQRKATFWSAYIRALKGTEDMRANDSTSFSAKRGQRARSEVPDMFPRIFDDLPTSFTQDPSTRIHAPGYRYLPVSQETYGSAPRLSCRAPSPAPAGYVPRYSRK